jgi:N-acetylneuraminate synthase
MQRTIDVQGHKIGAGSSCFIVAEVSANHNGSFDHAVEVIHAAKEAGADAVKLQTYTPDTLTIRTDRDCFRIGGGTLWDGKTLYDLYAEAYTPWDWHPGLKRIANDIGLALFSTPFDPTAVDFLEELHVPMYKVASCEIVDLPLITKIANTGKPMLISTGMATLEEIEEAVVTAQAGGAKDIVLLKCTSAYPARPEDIHLRTIPYLAGKTGLSVGLSDHTLGISVPVAAVTLGACVVEKHITTSRSTLGPDSAFSLEPHEFAEMVKAIRTAESALGEVHFGVTPDEAKTFPFRRSLFIVRDMKRGEIFNSGNIRSIRPGYGLHTRHMDEVLGAHASCDIAAGTPLSWDLVVDWALIGKAAREK